jgi:hypothetical protein
LTTAAAPRGTLTGEPRRVDHAPVGERLFTPEQANAALPRVRPLVEQLVERRADLLAVRARRAEIAAHVAGNGGLRSAQQAALDRAARAAEEGLHEAVAALTALGVVVKDVDAGLVDFPALRDGERVFLCWQLGEDAVAFWHGLEEGFAGRKPLAG